MYGVIEGTGFEALDPSFNDCLIGHARVERLWTGARWSEGPVWFAAGKYLLWSDIPNNRILRFDDIAKGGWSRASTSPAASPAPNITARSL